MAHALQLDTLLAQLEQAGLRMGIAETLRLRHVFEVHPPQSEAELRGVLAAVVVKSVEQQVLFDRIFEPWWSRLSLPARSALEIPASRMMGGQPMWRAPSRRVQREKPWVPLTLVLGVMLGVALLTRGPDLAPEPEAEPEATLDAAPERLEPPPQLQPHDDSRPVSFVAVVPVIDVDLPSPLAPLLLGCLAALVGAGVWLKQRRNLGLTRRPVATDAGCDCQPSPLKADLCALLSRAEAEAAAWGLGRFVTDEETRTLDLDASVRATADAGGVPVLRFERAHHERGVWLWTDASAEEEVVADYARALGAAFSDAGLAVEQAGFWGVPDELFVDDGPDFAPADLEDRRHSAVVLIFTDGRMLGHQVRTHAGRREVGRLFRALSGWPRLVVVDFARGEHGLSHHLAGHDLTVIHPEEVTEYLLGRMSPACRLHLGPVAGDVLAWAGACALGPIPVDEAAAQALREHLRLPISPWYIQTLRHDADCASGRLAWPSQARIDRINGMVGLQRVPDEPGALPNDGLLAQTLAFWRQRCHARGGLSVECALLALWTQPKEAAQTLYDHFTGDPAHGIRQALQDYTARDLLARSVSGSTRERSIRLPWRWRHLELDTQMKLLEMGFAARAEQRPVAVPHRPGRLWLGIGALAGLALGAWATAGARWGDDCDGRAPHVTAPKGVSPIVEPRPDGQWRIGATTVHGTDELTNVQGCSAVEIAVQSGPVECRTSVEPGAAIWRCGRKTPAPRSAEWAQVRPAPDRRLAVIAADPADEPWHAVADALLDGGTADAVLMARNWRDRAPWQALAPSGEWTGQLIGFVGADERPSAAFEAPGFDGPAAWVAGRDPNALVAQMQFKGLKPASEIWPGAVTLGGDVWVQGLLSDPCVDRVDGTSEVWTCNPDSVGLQPAEVETLSIVQYDNQLAGARMLAGRLLDTRSVGRVLLTQTWPTAPAWQALTRDTATSAPMLVVVTSSLDAKAEGDLARRSGPTVAVASADLAELADGLNAVGTLTIEHVWPESHGRIVLGKGDAVSVKGTGVCPPREKTEPSGIEYVRMCAGTFQMGTTEAEKGYGDERPRHTVRISPFWMAKYETSNTLYRRDTPGADKPGDDTLPVAKVDWNEASAFCARVGGRLPTEAEWEYAARAGTQTAWSFGDDDAKLGEYAWFESNSGGEAHPVGTKKPNPWGLYDMHGNVWEWNDDWYDKDIYKSRTGKAVLNPRVTAEATYRLLRGGSFANVPGVLRSGVRYWFGPEVRNSGWGFRCALGPRREHRP